MRLGVIDQDDERALIADDIVAAFFNLRAGHDVVLRGLREQPASNETTRAGALALINTRSGQQSVSVPKSLRSAP